jgi:hypothetical protein
LHFRLCHGYVANQWREKWNSHRILHPLLHSQYWWITPHSLQQHPQLYLKLPESFWFAKEDYIMFSSAQAGGLTSKSKERSVGSRKNLQWLSMFSKRHTMLSMSVSSWRVVNKEHVHVTSTTTSHCEHCIEGIEQHCHYEHID